jgi:hypothetical protein
MKLNFIHTEQEAIRNSYDSKYYQINGHPEHNKWQQDQNRGRRRH